jgi:hypothetical protein
MRFPLALVLLLAALAVEEWRPLFDGKTLDGWHIDGSADAVKVIDGVLTLEGPDARAVYDGPANRSRFKNFEFQAEVNASEGASAALLFHIRALGTGYEVALTRRGYARPGSLLGIRNQYKSFVRDDAWFTLRILVRGKHVQVRVNDIVTADYTEPANPLRPGDFAGRRLSAGPFALVAAAGRTCLRDVRVKPLPEDLADDIDGPVPAEEPCPDLLRLHMAGFPLVNLHAHLKGGLTLDDVLALSRRTGIEFGVAPNCGVGFPITDDKGIADYVAAMTGRPIFLGMQAEGREWVKTFSPAAIAQFDYVFTDSMTFVDDRTGKRTRLWLDGEFEVGDEQQFMDMLVNKIEGILRDEPIDVYANPTFLPAPIVKDYERLWTPPRMQRVVDALARSGVAMEINARYRLPSPAFIKLARRAGVKFTIGTNNAGKDDLGVPDYCLRMITECELTPADLFIPGPEHRKAIDRKAIDRKAVGR